MERLSMTIYTNMCTNILIASHTPIPGMRKNMIIYHDVTMTTTIQGMKLKITIMITPGMRMKPMTTLEPVSFFIFMGPAINIRKWFFLFLCDPLCKEDFLFL